MNGHFVAVRTALLILLFGVQNGTSITFWEFLFGPSLADPASATKHDYSPERATEDIVRGYGYRLDTHLVASATGHILTLHRIPSGHKRNDHLGPRPVAFIHHGLLGCSDMWLLRGPKFDLPYLLADFGYDVWLFNARGSVHSRKHKFLNADKDADYWKFGIEEFGYYDLPVTIDYILNATNQKDLFFLGHSIGCSAGFVMCAMHPEYNEKIRLFVALGPLTNVRHTLNPIHKIIFAVGSVLVQYLENMQIYELFPRRAYASRITKLMCENGSPMQNLCLSSIFSLVGSDLSQFNTTFFSRFVYYYPAGTSLNVIRNVLHYYLSGEFGRSDFGTAARNLMHYNSTAPPVFDFSKVTAPVVLYYGPGDLLVTREDVNELGKRLPKLVGIFPIPHKQFNHLDFVLAVNGRSLLYDSLLNLMQRYS